MVRDSHEGGVEHAQEALGIVRPSPIHVTGRGTGVYVVHPDHRDIDVQMRPTRTVWVRPVITVHAA